MHAHPWRAVGRDEVAEEAERGSIGPACQWLPIGLLEQVDAHAISALHQAPLTGLREGAASRFDAPAGTAFVMADGGENNSPGDPTFGGFLTRDGGQLRAFAITCPHLGCSYAFDDGKKHFVCPCHGSEFALDGSVIHGPATAPLSHLTWQPGPGVNEIDVEGSAIGG